MRSSRLQSGLRQSKREKPGELCGTSWCLCCCFVGASSFSLVEFCERKLVGRDMLHVNSGQRIVHMVFVHTYSLGKKQAIETRKWDCTIQVSKHSKNHCLFRPYQLFSVVSVAFSYSLRQTKKSVIARADQEQSINNIYRYHKHTDRSLTSHISTPIQTSGSKRYRGR